MTAEDDRRLSPADLQRRDGEDLSFGGWRDWLLLVIGLPIFLGALYGGAMLSIGSRSGDVMLSPLGGLVVAAIALVVGIGLGSSARVRRRLWKR